MWVRETKQALLDRMKGKVGECLEIEGEAVFRYG